MTTGPLLLWQVADSLKDSTRITYNIPGNYCVQSVEGVGDIALRNDVVRVAGYQDREFSIPVRPVEEILGFRLCQADQDSR